MIAILLIAIPLFTGILAFFIRSEKAVKAWALLSALVTLGISLFTLMNSGDASLYYFREEWMPGLGSSFSLKLDGMGKTLCLLTAIAFPVAFITTWHRSYANAHNFFALMLLSQAGLMGVFLAMDALVFYFFWELALIPVYFLCSLWGGERRIAATFKFFIYTFIGSLIMLVGLIYLQSLTKDRSFDIASFYDLKLSRSKEALLFWMMFIAFAIKMPIFPFHTWQPDTYEQSPTAVTMILSGVMVKMGVFAVIRWLLPVFPTASYMYGETTVSVLAVIGMVYASIIAIRQNDMKRLIAYSSIAHIGLMCIAIFSESAIGMQGVMFQMFAHGINIIGLWVIVELIERQYGTRKLSELGGIAQRAPALSIAFVILALANIALPLTNAFVGEFMMFNGIFNSPVFRYEIWFTVFAGVCIILAAVYTLRMVQKVLYGELNQLTSTGRDIRLNEKFILGVLIIIVLALGIYPQVFLNITDETTDAILKEAGTSSFLISRQ